MNCSNWPRMGLDCSMGGEAEAMASPVSRLVSPYLWEPIRGEARRGARIGLRNLRIDHDRH